jgi:FtsH-binding integral membrane protein
MIQRIQTVYLTLGALVLSGVLFLESLWGSEAAATYGWFLPVIIGLGAVTAVTAIGAIFLYTDRETQRTVVVGTQLMTILWAITLYGSLFMTNELQPYDASGLNVNMLMLVTGPLVAYILFWLARRGIEHDIELVASMDRLR